MRKFFLFLPLLVLFTIGVWYLTLYEQSFERLWLSADKQAQVLELNKQAKEALEIYENKLSIGAIYYKKGNFTQALHTYESLSSKEAFFNRGNAQVMLGKYKEAMQNYDLVLELEPKNIKAKENRELAGLRQKQLEKYKGTSAGTSKIGADKVVYDNTSKKGDDYKEEGTKKAGSEQWLDRLETSPGNFLRAKFAYQYRQQKKQPQ